MLVVKRKEDDPIVLFNVTETNRRCISKFVTRIVDNFISQQMAREEKERVERELKNGRLIIA